MKPGLPTVEVNPLDPENDPFAKAALFMIATCINKGAQSPGDQITIMVPDGVQYGVDEDGPYEEMGEWQITLKKVS